jgi:RHS repeat-associated protein
MFRGNRKNGLKSWSVRLPIVLAAAAAAQAAHAQDDAPPVISPLRVESEHNGVNLATGKISLDGPVLSVPAAPNLAFDRVQNAAPYVKGSVTGGPGEYPVGNYSVHMGASSSESFRCIDTVDCESVTGTGSTFRPVGLNSYRFQQAGTGAIYTLNLKHVNTTSQSPRVIQYYASGVSFPNGETISYSYQTAYLPWDPARPFYRPVTVTSNMGYFISLTYQGNDFVNDPGSWARVATATIYASAAPTVPLRRLSYSGGTVVDSGDTVADTSDDRSYICSDCGGQLGVDVEAPAATLQLPGDSTPALQAIAHPSAPVVASVTRDGVQWNYSYQNLQQAPGSFNWLYSSVTVTGPNGFNQTYQMSQGGTLTSKFNAMTGMTDSLGRPTSLQLDWVTMRVTRMTNPEGNAVSVGYDDAGNVVTRTTHAKPGSGLADITETANYTLASLPNLCTVTCWRPNWIRDGLGRQTDLVHSGGMLTERTDPADAAGVRRRTIIEYTAGIARKSVVRVCGVGTTCGTNQEIRTEYQYVGSTSLVSRERRIDPATGQYLDTTYTYDAAGRLLSTDGPLPGDSDATFNRYDQFGRKTWEIGAVGGNGLRSARRHTYRNSDDKLLSTETGTVPTYDSPTLTVLMRTDRTYDSRRYEIREAASSGGITYTVTDRANDDQGRLVCSAVRMNPAAFGQMPGACAHTTFSAAYGYDRITYNVYDAAGQRLQEIRAYLTPSQQNYATYTYNANGTMRTLADANGNTSYFNYNGHDRRDYWVMPSRTATGSWDWTDYEYYAYDLIGNRTTWRKRDGSILSFQYDNLNRMILKVVPERAGLDPTHTRDVYYAYDLRNQQTEARFDSLSGDGVSSAYDAFGRQISSTLRSGSFVRSLGYGYDPGGRRTGLTHPDTQQFTYAYSSAGELMGVYQGAGTSAPLAQFGYYPSGLISVRYEGGGSNATYGYDAIGRLNSQTDAFVGGTGNVTLGFAHSPASQIVLRTRSNDAYASNTAYDVSRNYAVNGLNQYTAAGSATFAYDANGNLISDGTHTYTYDVENRLVGRSGGVQLGYDPLGRLAWSTGSPNFTRFVYDGDALVAEYDYSGNLVHRYVHGSDTGADDPLVWYDGGTIRYLHADHQGSIVATTNTAGALHAVNAYDPWGIPNAGNQGRFQYTGQAWLGELGMYHYKARIYSPTLGRFLQVDPVGYDDQVNLYAYAGNNPVSHTDPTGMRCDDDGKYCDADTYDAARSNGATVQSTPAQDRAVDAQSSTIPTDRFRETFGYTTGSEEGQVQVNAIEGTSRPRVVFDPVSRQFVPASDVGSFTLPGDASTAIHRHIDGVTQGMDTDPQANGGWGDSQPLGLSVPRPSYVIHGDRVGVRELVNGQLRFRMISGTLTLDERRQVQGDLNREQRMFQR